MAPETRKRRGGEGGKTRREAELAELAQRQHGVVGRGQLLALGFGRDTIRRWLLCGRLHRLHREAYAVGHALVNQRGRWRAAVLACGDGALLSHRSAAALWGLVRPRDPIDVNAPRGRQYRPGRLPIRLHRCRIDPDDRALRSDIPVTGVARTLFDMAETVTRSELHRAWEEADRLKLLRLREVEAVCERGYGRRALRPIRLLLAEARAPDPGRSPLEERFHRFLAERGLPAPESNVEVLGHEVDAYWPNARLIAELDGWEFHRHRAAFLRDRARDSARVAAGYRTLRVTHQRLTDEADALAAELWAMLGDPPRD